jgi:hypothetical protein
VNPLLAGPALVLRALDDLHALAEAAREMPAYVDRVETRLERIEDQMDAALGVAEQIERTATVVVGLGERIEQRAGEVIVLGGTLQELALQVLDEARVMALRAEAVAEVGAQVVAALPTLERAVNMATPLEGAVERVGRLVDRLPGGRLATHQAHAPAREPVTPPETTGTDD